MSGTDPKVRLRNFYCQTKLNKSMNLLVCGKIAPNRILPAKLLLIMRFIAILIFATALQVNAKNISAQKITFAGRNVPLRKVFSVIQQQSGLSLLYDNKLIKQLKNVDVHVKNASVEEALDECLRGLQLTYQITDKIIVIREKVEDTPPAPPQVVRG